MYCAAIVASAATDTMMVRLRDAVPGLLYDVRYATAQNFASRILYASDELWARDGTARALYIADSLARDRGLRLKVFDAYRPISVQRIMWAIMPDERYVANPAMGSRHNRGAAVDITLCDSTGFDLLPTEWWQYDLRDWQRFGILNE